MAGYSGTPLPQKLGIKPGATVVTINAPTNYRRLVGTIPEGVTFSDRLKPDSSLVHVFIKKRSELEKRLSPYARKSRTPEQFGFPGQKNRLACLLT
jgi:hypothetical protein